MYNAKSLITLIIFLALTFIYSSGVTIAKGYMAQTSPSIPQKEVTDVKTQEVSGTVLRKDRNKLMVQTDNGVKEFTIPQNVKVTRNTFEDSLNSIQPNDRVKLIASQNGQVLSIDSSSGEMLDWGKWALPGTLLGVMIVAMLFMAWKRTQQGHIKTEVPSV